MNPGPNLIIRNTFPTHLQVLLFSASFKSENTKTYLLSCIHLKNPKTPHTHHIYFILLHCYLLYLHHLFYFTYIYTLCLTTTRWSWGHKTSKLFCRLLEEERQELLRLFHESSILNPEFPRGEMIEQRCPIFRWDLDKSIWWVEFVLDDLTTRAKLVRQCNR
jgi:hypothetical protein